MSNYKLPNHKTLTLLQLKAKAANPLTPTRYRNQCIKRIRIIGEIRQIGVQPDGSTPTTKWIRLEDAVKIDAPKEQWTEVN